MVSHSVVVFVFICVLFSGTSVCVSIGVLVHTYVCLCRYMHLCFSCVSVFVCIYICIYCVDMYMCL